MAITRIRQLVLACQSLQAADTLRTLLDLGEPFADPGIAEFGLTNAVFALGDQFLEIIVPVSSSAPAQRFMDRSGQGGYMVILQSDDLASLRGHWETQSIRRIWSCDMDDISATHLHPADTGGAIVSVDEPRPPASWRWGGPDWQARSVPGRIIGANLTSPDPDKLARKWENALTLKAERAGGTPQISIGDSFLRFLPGEAERLSTLFLQVPDATATLAKADALGLLHTENLIRFANVTLVIQTDT